MSEAMFHLVLDELRALRQEVTGLGDKVEGLRRELHEQVADLRQEMQEQMAGLRQEMHEQVAGLRQEMQEQIAGLRQEMQERTAQLDGKIEGLRQEMQERTAQLDGKIEGLRQEMHDKFAETHSICRALQLAIYEGDDSLRVRLERLEQRQGFEQKEDFFVKRLMQLEFEVDRIKQRLLFK